MKSQDREPRHLDWIDAVRGIAFLMVLTVHTALSVGAFPKSSLLKAGGYGVQLFFVASAITLCNSMSVRQNVDRYPLISFYLRRFFRIAPLFWIAMIFYWTVPSVMPSFWLGQWAPEGVHPYYFVLTALFLHGWQPYTFSSIVPGGWSIAVEMTFYLVFPLLFRLLNSLQRAVAALFPVILWNKAENHLGSFLHTHLFPGTTPSVFNFFYSFWFPSQVGVFIVGIITYHLFRQPLIKTVQQDRYWPAMIFLFCVLAAPVVLIGTDGKGIPVVPMFFAFALIAISSPRLPLVVNPVICYIGRISYSCYLVHFAALGLTLQLFGIHLTADHLFFDAGSHMRNLMIFLALFFVTLGFTVLGSTLTLHLVEKPSIACGRRLIRLYSVKALL